MQNNKEPDFFCGGHYHDNCRNTFDTFAGNEIFPSCVPSLPDSNTHVFPAYEHEGYFYHDNGFFFPSYGFWTYLIL